MTNSTQSTCPKCGALIEEEAPQGLCPKCVLAGAVTTSTSSSPKRGTPPPTIEELSAEFPEFEILEIIGVGGMGTVYKARQPNLDRNIALKVLSRDLAENPAFVERFNREARMLARLDHPNIVTVFDFGNKGPFLYLLMEYVDGVNLRQAMQVGDLTPVDSLALVQEICAALQFAHEEGILHRDIKPENILIDVRGRVKIADFGIAKLIGKEGSEDFTLTSEGSLMGSLHYMAPEQIEQLGDIDERADIYSLGVVFYELLTGELPIGKFALPSEKTPVDSSVDDVVMRTLEKERELRYQTVEEVKDSVESITQSQSNHKDKFKKVPAKGSISKGKDSAKFATTSAVLTGISILMVAAVLLSSVFFYAQTGHGLAVWMIIIVVSLLLLVIGSPAIMGLIFGVKSLAEIRESKGTKCGLGRAMFGALAWPLLVIILLTSSSTAMGFVALFGPGLLWLLCATAITVAIGTFAILAVWRWGKGIPRGVRSHDLPDSNHAIGPIMAVAAIIVLIPTLIILVPWGIFTLTPGVDRQGNSLPEISGARADAFDEVDWRLERPEIELDLTIAPMHVATIAMVRTDASGKEKTYNLEGWAMASDERTFRGRVLIGSLVSLDREGKPRWVFCIEQFGGTYIQNDGNLIAVGGATGRSGGQTLSGEWVFDSKLPNKLELNAAGRHSMVVATPAKDHQGKPLSTDTLTLQVITQHRSGPGVPEDPISSGIIGGGSTDWIGSLNRK